MSKTVKIIVWVVVVIIAGGGIWWWMASQNSALPVVNNTPASGAAAATSTPNSAPSSSYPQGASDQSINQDMTSLDAQINGLSSDNASVTQSLSDQPVQQAQ